MKIPVCPRCKQLRTLHITETYTDGIISIRCFKVAGGCGALFTVHGSFRVLGPDTPELSEATEELYGETTEPPKAEDSPVLSNTPRRKHFRQAKKEPKK